MKKVSHSLEETEKIAEDWLAEISRMAAGRKNSDNVAGKDSVGESVLATVVGLSGHLGAGKTAFTKLAAKALGVNSTVTSPTFVLMKLYDINGSWPWKKLVHIDAYRFEKPEELKALNYEKIIADKDNLVLVEWPENVGLKPDIRINFRALEGQGNYEIEFV